MLKSKHVKAVKEGKAMKETFDQLSSSIDKKNVVHWIKEAETADFQRGDYLKIYGINLEKGIVNSMHFYLQKFDLSSDTSQMSMRTKLKSRKESDDSTVNWLCLGLDIEEGE
jgi:hypothetical protein